MPEPLRVVRVLARANVGGPALQVSVLSHGLDPTRFDQRLLVGTVAGDEADYLELRARDVSFVRIPGLGRTPHLGDDLRALRSIRREVHDFKPHIVHTHTAKAGALGRMAARWERAPATVHTFHGHLLHGYFSPVKTRTIVQTERVLARITTRIAAVGEQVRDDLLAARIGRPAQYRVVPPGVELHPLPSREVARDRLGLSPECPVITYVGRLIPVKRPDRLVATAAALAPRFPDLVTLVAGDGELRAETEASARASRARVQFLGWRGDVETIYAAADAVVLTSDNEGMPVSLIEGALAGRPAVTTAAGSAGEVVLDGETGFVTDASADALATAIERLLVDADLRRRMGAAAAERAHREFSAQRLIRDTEELYEEVAAETRALDRR